MVSSPTQQSPPSAGEQPFIDTGPTRGPADALVLDIGSDVGALILFADESCLGQEIDLSPAGLPRSHHTHTMIRRRRTVGREIIAGVYPELRAGDYVVWGTDGSRLGVVALPSHTRGLGRIARIRPTSQLIMRSGGPAAG